MKKTKEEIIQTTTQIIRERRSILPVSYTAEKIERGIIEEILQNANYAPTHRLTEPWRFKVITGEKLGELGNVLATLYKTKTPEEAFVERKYNKTARKPGQCSHVIAICMQRDEKERVPEWEEIASVAMSVQNMWLTATSYGIGAYWSSPGTITMEPCRQFLNLKEGERCLGFFFMGYHEVEVVDASRTSIKDKVEWL